MKKITVTSKQYKFISYVYRFGGFAFILVLLTLFSSVIGKFVEFLFIFFPYFMTKSFYKKQYHSSSLKKCFLISLVLFAFLTAFTIPIENSILFACIIGLSTAYLSYRAGVIQFKLKDYDFIEPKYNFLLDYYNSQAKFNVETCSEEQLISRCKNKGFTEENTKLAIEFFIKKTKQSVIADRLCIDEKSVTTRKKRMKTKLNSL